ncbi:MAG: ATP-binding protein [bacterium]
MEQKSYDSLIHHFNIIGEKIASSSGIEETLNQIASSARQVLGADPVILFQHDAVKRKFVPPAIYAGELVEEEEYVRTFAFRSQTFAELIVADGQSLYFEREQDIEQHPFMTLPLQNPLEGRPSIRFHEREEIKSMAALVLKAGREPVGLMFLNYRTRQEFTPATKKLMNTFGSYAAIAIKNSWLIEKLRQNEAFQKEVVEKMPDPVFVTRNRKVNGAMVWRIEVANRAAHELFGYDFHTREFEGKDAHELLGNGLAELEAALQENGGEVTNFEVQMSHKRGRPIPITVSTSILERDSAGRILRTICVAKDLSKTKELEKQLEHLNRATVSLQSAESLEQAYDTIFEHLSDIGYDKGMISLVDKTTRSIVGQRSIGEKWSDISAKTNVPLDSPDILARVVRAGEPILIEDCTKDSYCDQEMIRKAGIKSQYIIPLIAQEKVIGTLQIGFSDIPDLFKNDPYYLDESLKILSGFANQVAGAIQANSQKITINELQTTLADIGHEFRSPLHNINAQLGGLIYYLKKTYGDDQRVLKVARIVEEETFRGARQMKNALASAGESFERMGLNLEKNFIGETVSACADRFFETANKRGIRIIIRDSVRNLPVSYFDKSQMEQVFTNLIDNAVKYSYANQNIEITGDDHGRKLQISVKDLGVGIPERYYQRIFEGFSRSDILDATRFIPGTGLGLKIARKIIEGHNGKILVNSKPYFKDPRKVMNYEGYATVFIVLLPKNPKEQ